MLVSIRFQILFHSPPGVLFTFPSRYYSLSVTGQYLGLEGGPSCFRPGYTCPVLLWCHLCAFCFRLQEYYLLCLSFPTLFGLHNFVNIGGPQPQTVNSLVWPLSLSLAATQEIDFSFSSQGYLDVSVHPVPFIKLCIHLMIHTHYRMWVPPFGNLRVYRICAPYRSLSQLITSFIGSQCQGIHPMLFVLDQSFLSKCSLAQTSVVQVLFTIVILSVNSGFSQQIVCLKSLPNLNLLQEDSTCISIRCLFVFILHLVCYSIFKVLLHI